MAPKAMSTPQGELMATAIAMDKKRSLMNWKKCSPSVKKTKAVEEKGKRSAWVGLTQRMTTRLKRIPGMAQRLQKTVKIEEMAMVVIPARMYRSASLSVASQIIHF